MYTLQVREFVSAGYYLTRRARPSPCTAGKLIPNTFISASSCICDFFPDSWTIRWSSDERQERERAATDFGIPADKIDAVIEWATAAFQKMFGWPNAFYSLDAAVAARREFVAREVDVAVFGLALQRNDAARFLEVEKPRDTTPGYSQGGETGIYECLKSQSILEPGGRHIGFELLATMFGILTCSWLCNGLETVCAEELSVKPNEYGLIADYSDARRCAEYVSRDEIGAEPGLWLPWLITTYSA
jgi:hypothetical protein